VLAEETKWRFGVQYGLGVLWNNVGGTHRFEAAACHWPGHGPGGDNIYWALKASAGYTYADAKAKDCPSDHWDLYDVPVTEFSQQDVLNLIVNNEPARKLWWWPNHPAPSGGGTP
jgi:hypothetical protein